MNPYSSDRPAASAVAPNFVVQTEYGTLATHVSQNAIDTGFTSLCGGLGVGLGIGLGVTAAIYLLTPTAEPEPVRRPLPMARKRAR